MRFPCTARSPGSGTLPQPGGGKKILETCISVLSSVPRNFMESDMTLRTAFVALVLGLTPAMAWASCSPAIHTTAAACGEGQVWDSASGTCVTPPTS